MFLRNAYGAGVTIAAVCALLFPISAFSLTIDNFSTTSHDVKATGSGTTSSNTAASANSMGGFRTITTENTGGTLNVEFEVEHALQVISHSQDAGVTGQSTIIWDGDNSTALDPDGLGGIDFTQDGGTAVLVKVVGFDPGSNNDPIDVTLNVYDASDASGASYWSATHTFNGSVSNVTLTFPFNSFVHSSGGTVDFTNVGAMSLFIDGSDTAVDVTFSSITTDGQCPQVPAVRGRVIDECGVCGGDDSTCTDCLGVINGSAVPGSTCTTKLPGACEPGQYSQLCDCEPINPPTNEICDGQDNDCDGEIDEENPDCIDCKGIIDGTATYDQCGVCEGDGTSCRTCEEEDLNELLTELDGGAKKQEKLNKIALKRLRAVWKNRDGKRYIRRVRKETHQLQLRNWTLSWTVPAINVQCNTTIKCIVTSNAEILSEYRTNSEALKQLGIDALQLVKEFKGKLGRGEKKVLRRIRSQHKANMELADTVPMTNTACSD